jgi:glycopeptide antibiotics resistance protein
VTTSTSRRRSVGPTPADLWSNRILILALIGIFYLTSFPFRFDFSRRSPNGASVLLLGSSAKYTNHFDFFLNVLLFIPLGYGISAQTRKRGAGRIARFLFALVGGFLVSYMVEFLQFFEPLRSSGWDDIVSNTTGSLAGFIFFELAGGSALRMLSRWETGLRSWLSPLRASALLLSYFAVWAGVSIILQEKTRLSNWDTQYPLFVGNDFSGENPWKGQIFRLQIWDRALTEKLVHRLEANADSGGDVAPLAAYDFTGPAPYADQRKFLSALISIPANSSVGNPAKTTVVTLDGQSWLGTGVPAADLTRKIKAANQFTFRVICTPASVHGRLARIISISGADEDPDFHLRQQMDSLVLWFRNPLSDARSNLAWIIPDVFQVGRQRDIFVTYDGTNAAIYVDGNKVPQMYQLGPGASLMHAIFHVNVVSMNGYVVLYETLVFLPAGMLFGLSATGWLEKKRRDRFLLALSLMLPTILLEIIVTRISGSEVHPRNILMAFGAAVAGVILVDADAVRKTGSESLGQKIARTG